MSDSKRRRDVRQVVLGAEDEDIKEHLEDNPQYKFSTYVKELIRKDINGGFSSDIVEARLNEIITLLKRGVPTNNEKDALKNNGINNAQRQALNNTLGLFKTK